MSSIAKRSPREYNVWPGYVDALSALLMVVIFLVLIFSIAQFLQGQVLSGQEGELAFLQRKVNQLTSQLGLEDRRNRELAATISELFFTVATITDAKTVLGDTVAQMAAGTLQDQAQIEQQLLMIGSLQEDIDALRPSRRELEDRVGGMTAALQSSQIETGMLRDRSKALEARMADAQERTQLAQQATQHKEIQFRRYPP